VDPYTVRRIDDMYATWLGAFKHARAELGVTSFGISVMDLPPNTDAYPEHDHADDGQEEVYLALSGEGRIEIEGETHAIDTETMVRVGPGVKRKITTSGSPLRLLALGGVPGAVYEPAESSRIGAPDPLTQPQ
jgi:mannose-6-phosphate isomerase-like protein (cupin superfamily)